MDLIKSWTDEYAAYLRDESRLMGKADSISFPRTEQEIIEVVKCCAAKGTPITAQGARTGLSGGASPLCGHVMNLSRMSRILGIRYDESAQEYYLRVQPGASLLQVRKSLENKNFDVSSWDDSSKEVLAHINPGELIFGPDPTEPTASLGGMASCNSSGSRSLLYGPTRDHIKSLRVVLSDGSVTMLHRGGPKANGMKYSLPLEGGGERNGTLPAYETPKTKDAGYYIKPDMDLMDLFIGSMGTLGIISELEIRLCKAPKHQWAATAFLPDDYASIDYVRILRGEILEGKPHFTHKPAAIEFFDKHTLDMLEEWKKITPAFSQLQPLPPAYCSAVYTEFTDDSKEGMWRTLEKLCEVLVSVGGNPKDSWVADGLRNMEKLIFFRHAVPECVDLIVDKNKAYNPNNTILGADMAVPDQYIRKVYDMYQKDLMENCKQWIIFGHVGETHFHPNLFPKYQDEYDENMKIFEKWAAQVSKWGGTITAEHGIGKIKINLARIMYGPENLRKLQDFKHSLDPQSLLSPGNMIG